MPGPQVKARPGSSAGRRGQGSLRRRQHGGGEAGAQWHHRGGSQGQHLEGAHAMGARLGMGWGMGWRSLVWVSSGEFVVEIDGLGWFRLVEVGLGWLMLTVIFFKLYFVQFVCLEVILYP